MGNGKKINGSRFVQFEEEEKKVTNRV